MKLDDKENDPYQYAKKLSQSFDVFVKKYAQQFHIKIPAGNIPTINDYKKKYFSYLSESQYKLNLCYLLQQVDYQIWLYKLFRPDLSIRNSTFYMLLILMGIVSESLAVSILIDPVIKKGIPNQGIENLENNDFELIKWINRNSFAKNIELLETMNIIPQAPLEQYHSVRENLRNIVHIQNLDGRLYNSLSQETFQERFNVFQNLLLSLNEMITMRHNANDLRNELSKGVYPEKKQIGRIYGFIPEKGYGFIESQNQKYFLHFKNCKNPQKIKDGAKVIFYVAANKKGLYAAQALVLD